MRFCTLSSCSYANCVVVQDQHTCILIDCGLRKRDTRPYLAAAGLSPGDVDAIILTHRHIDHVYGLNYFLKEKNVPIYSTIRVLHELNQSMHFTAPPRLNILSECSGQRIGTLGVIPFRLSHDVETIGFIIHGDGERLGFITDTGFVPESCLNAFRDLDYLYIESNHDLDMYKRSAKPGYVIRRNLGLTGHLSNEQCGRALQAMRQQNYKLVVLGHLSEEDNEPRLALDCAMKNLPQGTPLASAPSREPGLWSDNLIQLIKEKSPPE
ncbi:putative metallo-hydrolase YycJ [Pelotomaculum sp. FP]|uniref:MBL fold metallo-hydrolase n=1 Tax=Pelotomaculum sp. FP TaxID=261474 RepID=UPI001066FBDB|nr:MBL fold metallo-hydrolase [Pelotomaculum sp. FP]TEB14331.1 putative metallo-hydrolase YycJ [Pelotomaculum sp. FP]